MTPPTSPETADIETIAGRLDGGVKYALLCMAADWQASPGMSDNVLDHLADMRNLDLVEREFGDIGRPSSRADTDGVTIHLQACWWFRPTALGEQIRAHLRSGDPQ